MSVFKTFRKTLAKFLAPTLNSMSLPNQFLKYGNQGNMYPGWSQVIMSDKDLYTGYSYAAISNRATWTAQAAIENIRTKSGNDDYDHPYLDIINDSREFTNFQFWNTISTYLDLEGIFYLMAIRAVGANKVGAVQEFKLLNPYNVRRVLDRETLKPAAYTETRNGLVREIPPELIIEVRKLNPFDQDKPFSMTDAAKDSQFTLQTSNDYTRSALQGNVNAPGIVTTDVILPEEQFANLIARVRGHKKGEPLFGNGDGAIKWQDMQTDLSKAALKEIHEMNREALFVVSGVSKTIMGIEQSGTTRDTAKVQKELYMEGQILPQIQVIIDALNQDYQNNYIDRFNPVIVVDNPTKVDHEADLKETELKLKQFELLNTLVNKGHDEEKAAKYVAGDISVSDLGEPENEPIMPPIEAAKEKKDDDKEKEDKRQEANALVEVTKMIQDEVKNINNSLVEKSNKINAKKSKFSNELKVIEELL